MLVYLDTRDLIELLEKSKLCSASQFNNYLRAGGHELVLSYSNVMEISAPLWNVGAQTNVMSLLNLLEAMPLRYIAEVRIPMLELQEALAAFSASRDYEPVSPFVARWDETLGVFRQPLTRLYLRYSLPNAVFDLWRSKPHASPSYRCQAQELRRRFAADRTSPLPIDLRKNFVGTLGRHLTLYQLAIPPQDLQAFAEWIYGTPMRCPSVRLSYEVYHAVLANLGDIPKNGDIPDFAAVSCVPYVDLVTLDQRMYNYARQVSGKLSPEFTKRICREFGEVLNRLKMV